MLLLLLRRRKKLEPFRESIFKTAHLIKQHFRRLTTPPFFCVSPRATFFSRHHYRLLQPSLEAHNILLFLCFCDFVCYQLCVGVHSWLNDPNILFVSFSLEYFFEDTQRLLSSTIRSSQRAIIWPQGTQLDLFSQVLW